MACSMALAQLLQYRIRMDKMHVPTRQHDRAGSACWRIHVCKATLVRYPIYPAVDGVLCSFLLRIVWS